MTISMAPIATPKTLKLSFNPTIYPVINPSNITDYKITNQ